MLGRAYGYPFPYHIWTPLGKVLGERILPSICFQAQATPIHDPRGSILGNGKGPPTPPFYDTLGRYHRVPLGRVLRGCGGPLSISHPIDHSYP